MTDAEIAAAFAGDADGGVEQFITRYTPLVEAAVGRILHSGEDGEQAVIDVFFKLWRSRKKLPQNEEIIYYILAASRRVAIDYYRREKRRPPSAPEIDLSAIADERGAEAGKIEIEEFLSVLPQPSRELFAAYYLCGCPARELAQRCGLPLPTVYTRLRRARAALQRHYRQQEAEK